MEPPVPAHKCSLCGKPADYREDLLGALLGPVRGAYVHRLCALWCPLVCTLVVKALMLLPARLVFTQKCCTGVPDRRRHPAGCGQGGVQRTHHQVSCTSCCLAGCCFTCLTCAAWARLVLGLKEAHGC